MPTVFATQFSLVYLPIKAYCCLRISNIVQQRYYQHCLNHLDAVALNYFNNAMIYNLDFASYKGHNVKFLNLKITCEKYI